LSHCLIEGTGLPGALLHRLLTSNGKFWYP
jgi:hypothetical protein